MDLDVYTNKELDIDYSYYRRIKTDVTMYQKGINPQIDLLLSQFRDKVDKLAVERIYIKGNRLFFTLDGVKYWDILTCWVNEWALIGQLVEDIKTIAEQVCYLKGELD